MSCSSRWLIFTIVTCFSKSLSQPSINIIDASTMSDADQRLCLGWTDTSNQPPQIAQLHGPRTINNFICPQTFTVTCDVVGDNLLWYLISPQVNHSLFTFLTSDHEQTSDDCSVKPDRVKHTTKMSDSEHLHVDFWGVLINRTTVNYTTTDVLHKCNSSLIVNPILAPVITLACRTHCLSAHLGSGTMVQSLLVTKFPMVPARVENLKYNYDFNGLFKHNSSDSEVNCSVIKITWDPPSNYNETAIDHYEVTVHVGLRIQHVNVINTEWIFIPSELPKLVSLDVLVEATNLLLDVSVSAVDICGQNGTSSTLSTIDLFCYRHDLGAHTTCSITAIILNSINSIISIIVGLAIWIYTCIKCFRRAQRVYAESLAKNGSPQSQAMSASLLKMASSQTAPPCPPRALTTSLPNLLQPATVSINLSPSKQQSKFEGDLDTTGQQNSLPRSRL